jgi:hypothetical protein
MEKSKKIKPRPTEIAIAVAFAIVVIAMTWWMLPKNSPLPFTPEKWNAQTYNRHRMMDSLTEQYDLTSMDKDGILELLGYTRLRRSADDTIFAYSIKQGTVNDTLLRITFDADGNVLEYSVGT